MSSYQPFEPARRPGGRPDAAPAWRVLVHRKYRHQWNGLENRVGTQQAQQFWDHVAQTPNTPPEVGSSTILRGKIGLPIGPGWSRTVHYEITGAGRINYQYNPGHRTSPDGDAHPVVIIRTIELGSH